jgi:hypothetical protein
VVVQAQNVYFTIPAGQTQRVAVIRGRCQDFDAVGAEEIYSSANIAIDYGNSGWTNSSQVSTTC